MTKRQHAERGLPCSWSDCPAPVAYRILDDKRRLVRYWCEQHYQDNVQTLAGLGWTSEPHGGPRAKPDQALSTPRPASGRRGDRDHSGAPGEGPGDTVRGPAGDPADRRLTLRPAPSPGPVDTAGPEQPDRTIAVQSGTAPEVPSLAWWQGAGELQLSREQQSILWQKVDPEAVQIRPDGIVYLPWAKVWRVLLEAFSPYVPSLVPLGKPLVQDRTVCHHVAMVVAGHFLGDAVGECRYQPGNRNMSWASCVEGAVSDAVVKISKRLGMFQELWSVPWVNTWRHEHAVRSYRTREGKWEWRRIEDEPFFDEGDPRKSAQSAYQRPRTFDDDAREHMATLSGKNPDDDFPQ